MTNDEDREIFKNRNKKHPEMESSYIYKPFN